jgi:hypothetical protein
VVVLAPGFETAPWRYTTLDEELASRGRVVALLVPPTTPARVVDGRQRTSPAAPATPTGAEVDTQIHRQAADMTALLDAFISADSPAPGPVDTRRTSSPPTSTATIAGAGHNAFGDPVHYFVAPPAGAAAGIGDIPAHRMHIVLTSTLDTTINELLHNGRIVDPSTATDLPELVRGSG